jgi:hypothetical protein
LILIPPSILLIGPQKKAMKLRDKLAKAQAAELAVDQKAAARAIARAAHAQQSGGYGAGGGGFLDGTQTAAQFQFSRVNSRLTAKSLMVMGDETLFGYQARPVLLRTRVQVCVRVFVFVVCVCERESVCERERVCV